MAAIGSHWQVLAPQWFSSDQGGTSVDGKLQWLAWKCESLSLHPHGKVGRWRQVWILLTAVASHPDNSYALRLGGTTHWALLLTA